MIIVTMNIAKFFMGGKPVDQWDDSDFDITNFSLLDELVRNQKVKSIGVALLPTDMIQDEAKALKFRKICDYFRLPCLLSWKGCEHDRKFTDALTRASNRKLTIYSMEYIAVVSTADPKIRSSQARMRRIIYSPDDNRELIMDKIIDKIVLQDEFLGRRLSISEDLK